MWSFFCSKIGRKHKVSGNKYNSRLSLTSTVMTAGSPGFLIINDTSLGSNYGFISLGLKNLVTLDNEKIPSLQCASIELIRAVKLES